MSSIKEFKSILGNMGSKVELVKYGEDDFEVIAEKAFGVDSAVRCFEDGREARLFYDRMAAYQRVNSGSICQSF